MAPDDRRSAILAAAVPLLRERGVGVTTRELAEAAGVAEGTLFRVFPDKGALLCSAIAQAMDPQPVIDELAAVEPDADLPTAVRRAVDIMTVRSLDVARLLSVAHDLACRSADRSGDPSATSARVHSHDHPGHVGPPGAAHPGHVGPDGRHPVDAVIEAVGDLLRRHGGARGLRREPAVCARMLVAVVLTSTRTVLRGAAPVLSPDDVVELFLHGALSDAPTADAHGVPATASVASLAGQEAPC